MWLEALMLAVILLFESVFLPEAIPGTPCFRNLYSFRDVLIQLPTSPNTITGDFFLTTRKTLAAVRYPSVWLAGLAFAVPYGCPYSPFLSRNICSLVSIRHCRLDFESVPCGVRELVPLQPVEARTALSSHASWEPPRGMWNGAAGR